MSERFGVREVALIINPRAGRSRSASLVPDFVRTFERRGVRCRVMQTSADQFSAQKLAAEATKGYDTVIACGGDGTIHEVIQGLAGSSVALGVLPLGTANALARNLHLPLNPLAALGELLTFTPKLLPLGCAEAGGESRWFAVMAGAGPDAMLADTVNAQQKVRLGRHAYYLAASRLYLSGRFPAFMVEYREPGKGAWKAMEAIAMMASRVPDLGGLFSRLTRDSRLHHRYLVAHVLRGPAKASLAAWFTYGSLGKSHANPWLTTIEAEELRCVPSSLGQSVLAQLDGEPQGYIPMHLKIVPDALKLLMPDGIYPL